ncbi:MAG: hypothetical protein K9J85_02195 [Desulfobacteraceae bacterium]|nr:hypothetical protein [Desulfobacteraceae bacterium]
MNDFHLPYTHTLARLYKAQGHKDRLQDEPADAPSELALLMARWIDLLRRRRYFETKS